MVTWIEHFANLPWIFFSIILGLSFIHVFIPMIPLESCLVLLTGYLASAHRDVIFLIWLALSMGTSVGGITIYGLTYRKGEKLLDWKFIQNQVHEQNLKTAGHWFERYGAWIIFLGKCVPGMSMVAIFCCGLFRVKPFVALSSVIISNSLYYCALVVVGKYFGRKWGQLSPATRAFPLIALIIGVLLSAAVIYFLYRRYLTKTP